MKYRIFIVCWLVTGCTYLPIQDQHTVKKGETLARVEHRYQVSSKKIAELNGWADLEPLLSNVEHIKLTTARKQGQRPWRDVAYVAPAARFVWPIHGPITSKFGPRWGSMHNGIDILASSGTPIKAAAAGTVIHSGRVLGYGNLVILYNGKGYSTVYAHASKLKARMGQKIKKGQIIAYVGSTGHSTGPHLHFEVRKNKDAQNPLYYLP